MTGQEECVEALLQRGASVSVKDIRGRSPLHLASASGRVGALGALLQATNTSHSHTNLTDSKGYTPLHWACYNGIGTQREMFENHVNLGFFKTQHCTFFCFYICLSLFSRVWRMCGGVVRSGGVQEDYRELIQPTALCCVRLCLFISTNVYEDRFALRVCDRLRCVF